MPLLFGEPMGFYGTKPLLWPCVWKEFSVLSKRGAGPAACWLRALSLREGFGKRFREVVVPGRKHSVLTLHWKDLSDADKTRVWGELTGFLRERLQPG